LGENATASLVTTGVYKITFPTAHPNGAIYNVQLTGTDGYYFLKGVGGYISTSTILYVRCVDGANNASNSGFGYIVI